MFELIVVLISLFIFYCINKEEKKLCNKINKKYYFVGIRKKTPWDNYCN